MGANATSPGFELEVELNSNVVCCDTRPGEYPALNISDLPSLTQCHNIKSDLI